MLARTSCSRRGVTWRIGSLKSSLSLLQEIHDSHTVLLKSLSQLLQTRVEQWCIKRTLTRRKDTCCTITPLIQPPSCMDWSKWQRTKWHSQGTSIGVKRSQHEQNIYVPLERQEQSRSRQIQLQNHMTKEWSASLLDIQMIMQEIAT